MSDLIYLETIETGLDFEDISEVVTHKLVLIFLDKFNVEWWNYLDWPFDLVLCYDPNI